MASPSVSPSESPSESPSVSPSASESPSVSPSASESPSESPSISPSVSPSASESPSVSPSASRSPSASPSPSIPPGDENSGYTNIACCATQSEPEVVLPPQPVPAAPGKTHKPGLFVNVEAPLWFTNRVYVQRFSTELEAYQHTHAADGGYESCQFTVKVPQKMIDEWLENGLGRHVVVYSGETELVWEGFVSKVSFGIGALSASRGPLFDIANRVSVAYTPIIDAGVDPMVTGSATETPIAENTDSQARYGIIEKILSGGQLLDDGISDEAEEVRDLYLAEMKLPYTDESINLGQMAEPTMTIECLGYKEWFKVYAFNDYTATTITLDTKVKNILNADPNSIFSTDQSKVETNAQLTNQLEDSNRFANTILGELVALGDGADNRWVFGLEADRVCYYRAIPTEVRYLHSLTSSTQNLTLLDSTDVRPWNVKAGAWVELTDFLISETEYSPSDLRENPRLMFAEKVSFTAPNILSITGGRISSVKQRLNQLGVGGA